MPKISELTELGTSASTLKIPVVDTATSTTKYITLANLLSGAVHASVDINGGTIDGTTIGASSQANATVATLVAAAARVENQAGVTLTIKDSSSSTENGSIDFDNVSDQTSAQIAFSAFANDFGVLDFKTVNSSSLVTAFKAYHGFFALGVATPTSGSTGSISLESSLNVVTTQAATNNTVTLPAAAAGLVVVCVNTHGSNTLVVEAASADQVDGGSSTNVGANAVGVFFAKDDTDWYSLVA
jgi:hypothetical protein